MRFKQFTKAINDAGYNLRTYVSGNEVPDHCYVEHRATGDDVMTDLLNEGLPNFDPTFSHHHAIKDAKINLQEVGVYSLFRRVPNHVSDLIRRFANTNLESRKEPQRSYVAIAGKDLGDHFTGDNDMPTYTAYTDDLVVDDDAHLPELSENDHYHLTEAQKSKLTTVLHGEGIPTPLFIDVRDVDEVLG